MQVFIFNKGENVFPQIFIVEVLNLTVLITGYYFFNTGQLIKNI